MLKFLGVRGEMKLTRVHRVRFSLPGHGVDARRLVVLLVEAAEDVRTIVEDRA